jgi:uroporphyrinogen decarboxylase
MMNRFAGLDMPHKPDWEGLIDTIMRLREPDRVYHVELFHDVEVRDAIAERFDLTRDLHESDPWFEAKKLIAVQRFCGYDYVALGLVDLNQPGCSTSTEDTAPLARTSGRNFTDEARGPIMNWDDFERYPWPDPHTPSATRQLEWFNENLPDDMCLIGFTGSLLENLTWKMGYQALCYALYDQRDLVTAISDMLTEFYTVVTKRMLEFDRVRAIWGSDDMGFRSGTLISPADTQTFALEGHKTLAQLAHNAGRPYLLHSCGDLSEILPYLIDEAKIDGKHSFEDTIEDVRIVKQTYGRRIAMLGGIDIDFLCRSDEETIRERVRDVLGVCQPGGGYCLGTGNSVTNYIPLDSYLALVDEGMRYGG